MGARLCTPVEREVAFAVCSALHDAGVEAVLTGGSAATVYAPRAYRSRDLDFIVTFHTPEWREFERVLRSPKQGH